jgi:hypothetical protein
MLGSPQVSEVGGDPVSELPGAKRAGFHELAGMRDSKHYVAKEPVELPADSVRNSVHGELRRTGSNGSVPATASPTVSPATEKTSAASPVTISPATPKDKM